MKKVFLIVILSCLCILFSKLSFSQENRSPYPIIFVHGLNSDNSTWNTIIDQLTNIFRKNSNNIFHAVLNAYTYTKIEGPNNILGDGDDDVLVYFNNHSNQLSDGDLFAVNFKNFWNGNSGNPQLYINSTSTPGTNQSKSNQSAIYKQGYALKRAIQSVLIATGAEKVILVGHSMGGLAIREYLQRTDNGTTGTPHTWWIYPNSSDGHKVAKVVTIGTPHRGSNRPAIFAGADTYAEACRDLRHYGETNFGIYLFGGDEGNLSSLWYNKDIDCNGILNFIVGINDGNDGTSYSINMPLPNNIAYSWITSKYFLDPTGDLAVDIDRQWLYDSNNNPVPLGVADSIRTDVSHSAETSDYYSIIRGLDEPDTPALAYEIQMGKLYKGFATIQSNMGTTDYDWYKFYYKGGALSITLSSFTLSGGRIDFYTAPPIDNSNSAIFKLFGGRQIVELIPPTNLIPGYYYVRIRHQDIWPDDWQKPYALSINDLEIHNASNITKLEYFIDNDPGFGNGINVPITSGNDITKKHTIDLLSLSNGIHSLSLRAQDQFGIWSQIYTRPFLKELLIFDVTAKINKLEYFFNNDPAFGSGINIPITSDTLIDISKTLSVQSLTNGINTISFRARNDNGLWSLVCSRPFLKEDTVSNISEIKYSFSKGSFNSSEYSFAGFTPSNDIDLNFLAVLPSLSLDSMYYLRLYAKDLYSKRTFEHYHQFLVVNTPSPPPPPILSYPPNGTNLGDDLTPDLAWNTVPNVNYFHVQVSRDSNFTILAAENNNVLTLNWTPVLNFYSKYYWHVKAHSLDDQWSNWSETRNFTIALGVPVLYSPLNGSINQDTTINLVWFKSTSPSTFKLQVAADSNFYLPLVNDSTIADTVKTISGLNYNTKYYWHVKAKNSAGESNWSVIWNFITKYPTFVETYLNEIPHEYHLYQSYPNPFNPSTKIKFALPERAKVNLSIYNLLGEKVAELVNGELTAGYHETQWNASGFASGVYIYRLAAEKFSDVKKMIIVK